MIHEIFEELASTSSRLEKEKILRQNETNKLLQEAIRLALCPYTQFYIRKIPSYQTNSNGNSLDWAFEYLKVLSNRDKTGHDARDHLATLLSSLSENNAKVIEKIIAKDLRCGVQASTVNKVWPDLVPTYPCQLASPYEDRLLDRFIWPADAQTKEDGMRFNAILDSKKGTVDFRTRSGNVLDFLRILEKEFDFANGNNCVYDGELWVADEHGNPMPRKAGNGLLVKAQRGTITPEIASRVRVTLWDRISVDAFYRGYDPTIYSARKLQLRVDLQSANPHKIMMVNSRTVCSLKEAYEFLNEQYAASKEGMLLKCLLAPWEDKRSQKQIKFKAEKECDLRCTGINEGTGKYQGKIGSLQLQSEDEIIKVSAGSGLTDKDRELPLEFYLDKIISIVYNERIVDKNTGQHSLFLPRFIEVRNDKFEADSSNMID